MNDIQKALLDMLVDFDAVMTRERVEYFLAYGSTLGAVRHKGFIPWDDDIDVFIRRDDVPAFEKAMNAMPEKYLLQMPLTLDWPDGFYKIVLDGSVAMEESYPNSRLNHGLWIDVFILDRYPDSKFRRPIHRLFTGIAHTLDIMTGKCIGKPLLDPIQRTLILGIRCMHRLMDMIQDNDDCERLSQRCVSWRIMPAKPFEGIVRMPFEGHMMMMPSGWDEILTDWFGDYMTPPSEGDRETHIVKYVPREED